MRTVVHTQNAQQWLKHSFLDPLHQDVSWRKWLRYNGRVKLKLSVLQSRFSTHDSHPWKRAKRNKPWWFLHDFTWLQSSSPLRMHRRSVFWPHRCPEAAGDIPTAISTSTGMKHEAMLPSFQFSTHNDPYNWQTHIIIIILLHSSCD